MTSSVIQTSFNAGELAPALYARVDLTKYHSAAALLRNFFVDYRGGATTRPGTKYVLKAKSNTVRLIPFQASFAVTYILEFGPGYIRPFNNGAPVLEAVRTLTSVTNANPGLFTSASHGYSNGDWIFISGAVGMTQLNGNYYIVTGVTTNTYNLTDLYGTPLDTTSFGVYTPSSGTTQRVFTLLTSPYQASDLAGIKYAQDVNLLILCHPNYAPQVLTLNSATNWTIAAISFAPTISPPGGISVTIVGSGTQDASYVITAVDSNGQESSPSTPSNQTTVGAATTQHITWTAVTGAVAYNVYRTIFAGAALSSGQPFGYLGSPTTNDFVDSDITPNFAIVAPTPQNPFSGASVNRLTLTSNGNNYLAVPTVAFSGGSPTTPATGYCYIGVQSLTIANAGEWSIDVSSNILSLGNGVSFAIVTTGVNGSGHFIITSGYLYNPGTITAGGIPTNPVVGSNPSLTPYQITAPSFNLTWGVSAVFLSSPGAGYASAPSVTFVGGAGSPVATATAALGAAGAGNPSVPGFLQQRMFLGGPVSSPSQFNLSQPGAPFNFNTTFPAQGDNAIQETLANTVLNSIKNFVTVSAGGMIFTDKGAWLLNGGAPGAPVSALDIVANPQAYSGCSDLPPILTNQDLLYVQSKNSIVRDLAFNFYLNNYVGADISIISSHLFYAQSLTSWAWAEEPFKTVWVVRGDGLMLSLTFVKEQELVAWAHHDTQGTYTSVAVVNETTVVGNVDATYLSVQRSINGQTVTYIERMVELYYQNDYKSSWQVDAGIGYNGAAASTFSGAQHLAGAVVTGVADGVVINFTMPTSGTFVFGGGGTPGLGGIASASIVTVGLAFKPQLTTLPLDLGEPTVQGKRKSIKGLSAKVANTLGLSAGRSLTTVVPLNDTTFGALGTMSNTPVTGLVTGDVRLILDPIWDVYGQYSITQPNPYPATILGVVPEIETEDKS